MNMRCSKKIIFGVICSGLIILQFFSPERINGDITQDALQAHGLSPEVQQIIRQTCYDCHSHETKWNLLSKIAPASFLIVHDVEEGREHLNFSEWDKYTPEQKRHKWDECVEEVEEGHMPPWLYTLTHPEARLDDQAKEKLQAAFKDLINKEL